MRGKASVARNKPKSLMERLAALEQSGSHATSRRGSSRPRSMRTYFVLGLVCSGVAGCIALWVLLSTYPGRPMSSGALALPDALAAMIMPSRPAPAPPSSSNDESLLLDLPIERGKRAMAPFPLRITGIEDTKGVRVWVRGVPEQARLSKGERKDKHTWALRLGELEGLRLMLSDGTPDVFDVTIEVTSPTGAVSARTRARVRVIGAAASATTEDSSASSGAEPAPARRKGTQA